jgi:hypothetical protein
MHECVFACVCIGDCDYYPLVNGTTEKKNKYVLLDVRLLLRWA